MRQATALFFIIMIVGSQATTFLNSAQNKQSIIGEIQDKNSEFYQLLEEGSQYVVDEVLNLLKNLEDAARNDLAELIKAFKIEEAYLEKVLADATQVYHNQVKQCNFLESEQHALEHAIQVREEETARNNKKIGENSAQVQKLKAERCKGNELFVDHVIAHRDALLLFNLLTKAVDSYKAGSFVQLQNINQAASTLADYINHYGQTHAAEFNKVMVQLRVSIKKDHDVINTKLAGAGQRQSDQVVNDYASNQVYKTVGRVVERDTSKLTSHVDNQNGKIELQKLSQDTVRALADVKGQLLKVIEQLTNEEKTSRDTEEANEAAANQAFASVKSLLQDENRKLTRRNEQLHAQIEELKVRLARKIAQVKECRVQEALLLNAMKLAQQHLDEARARFRAAKAALEAEIALFSRLYVYYKERVYAVATKADRNRVQDYAQNQNFNKSGRNRQGDAYNGLNVNKYATEGSHKEVGDFKGF